MNDPREPDEGLDESPDGRILDPIDRNSEIMFGLFMVLTFTGTLSVASAGKEDIQKMLIAAIGCNTAWGFVDGVMYALRSLVVRARQNKIIREVRAAIQPEDGQRIIAGEIGPMAAGLGPEGLERLRQWMVSQPWSDQRKVPLTARELKGAFGVFLLVFASTFPVVLPFFFAIDLRLAMRLSAAIAVAIMLFCGYEWGRYAGLRPWRSGLVLALLGSAIEAVIIALGG